MQITSLKPDSTRAVSWRDSPLAKAEFSKPVVSRTSPPSRLNAQPKLMRVRVLGSKNILPKMAPSSTRVTLRRNAYGAMERSEEHTSELQSRGHLVCRLLLEKKKK